MGWRDHWITEIRYVGVEVDESSFGDSKIKYFSEEGKT